MRDVLTTDKLENLRNLCLDAEKGEESSRPEFWKRLKFSWHHPERVSLLAELKSYNASLDKLGRAAHRAKPYERKQQATRAHATFKLRDDAERLYQVISNACNCQSLRHRDVGLGLGVHHHHHDTKEGMCFHLLLFDSSDKVCAMTVKMINASQATEPPKKKKVRISLPKLQAGSDTCNKMTKLHDICKESQLAKKSHTRLQLVVDERGEVYTTGLGQSASGDKPSGDPILSLCEVMANLKLYDRKRWLHREKAILAVILAYSLLQLHESSWWQTLWNSRSIAFLGLGAADLAVCRSPDQRIRLRRPFTRSTIPGAGSLESPGPKQRKNAHLHALGVVLLELYLNRSIKDDVDAQGGSDYRGVAQDLLEEHSDDMNMTAEYLRAVQFCLSPHPNPYSGSFSFEDEGFRELFYSEVISLLEDNLTARFDVNSSIWRDDEE
jgi:hypothetical protein